MTMTIMWFLVMMVIILIHIYVKPSWLGDDNDCEADQCDVYCEDQNIDKKFADDEAKPP